MGPGTTCWPGGVLKCSPGVGGSKMASKGVELLLTPHAHHALDNEENIHTVKLQAIACAVVATKCLSNIG